VESAKQGYSCDWVKLLDASGISRAEETATAERELKALEKAGHFRVKYHRTKIIDRITLPLDQEQWLCDRFDTARAVALLEKSLRILDAQALLHHPVFHEEWERLISQLREKFRTGKSLRPFFWNYPDRLATILDRLYQITARSWPLGTLIRDASVQLGMDSKGLDQHRRIIEGGLSRLFGSPVDLKSLGLVSEDSYVELSGNLTLHFKDGNSQNYDSIRYTVIHASDLARCSHITTPATRLLTIENKKTTFRQFSAANEDRNTLLATTSFPTSAFIDLLKKLPTSLEHHHFGDTDPAGWLILQKLRLATSRPVLPFHMKWRPAAIPIPCTGYDAGLLPKLLADERLIDVRNEIFVISEQNDRGDFEQETLGAPCLPGWPFW